MNLRGPLVSVVLSLAVFVATSCSSSANDYCRAPDGEECLNLPDQCSKQPGCSLVAGCAASNCGLNQDIGSCAATETCRWNGTTCAEGNLTVCDGLDEVTCGSHAGCAWGMACVGMLEPCRTKTQAECEASSHCSWERVPDL